MADWNNTDHDFTYIIERPTIYYTADGVAVSQAR